MNTLENLQPGVNCAICKSDMFPVVASFQHLVEDNSHPNELRRDLVEIYCNYTRMLIQNNESQGSSVVAFGDHNNQLYTLMSLISVMDADNKVGMFSEMRPDEKTLTEIKTSQP